MSEDGHHRHTSDKDGKDKFSPAAPEKWGVPEWLRRTRATLRGTNLDESDVQCEERIDKSEMFPIGAKLTEMAKRSEKPDESAIQQTQCALDKLCNLREEEALKLVDDPQRAKQINTLIKSVRADLRSTLALEQARRALWRSRFDYIGRTLLSLLVAAMGLFLILSETNVDVGIPLLFGGLAYWLPVVEKVVGGGSDG